MIDWNKHEDATCVSVTYFDDNGDAISTSWADRPTQKTVADAVKGKWVEDYNMSTLSSERPLIGFNPAQNVFFSCESGYIFYDNKDGEYQVSTLDQFEAYVKEQEGEKWTHVDSDGNECRILHTIGDHSWVTYKNNSYEDELWPNVELRVIKPTISKSEAWDKLMQNKTNSAEVNTIKQQYDII